MFKPNTAKTILVTLAGRPVELFDGVSDLAEEHGWQLVDPAFSRGEMPPDLPLPEGAITTFLPDSSEGRKLLDMGIPKEGVSVSGSLRLRG